jgi:PAS domain S-box-containing protein
MAHQSIVARGEQFQRLLDTLPAGAYLCDADGLITYFNDHAVEVWGRAPALNDSVDRFCGSFRLFAIDGRPLRHDECWMALALKNGQAYLGQEILIERPDGARRTVLAHASPLYGDAGQLAGAVNVLVDISDRNAAEQARAMLGAIVESSDDAIVSKTLDGIIQSWNSGAERLFGFRADEAIGRPITIIIPPERLHEEQDILSRLCRGERIDHFETRRLAKDGRLLEISVTISPVRDSSGRIIGASKIARDISAQKNSEAALVAMKNALQDADQRKDEFLAMLAHELRNPLAAICNSLQLLSLDDSLSAPSAKVRDIMEQQTKLMMHLVDDLLDSSRISRGKIELKREPIDLASVVAGAVHTAKPFLEAAGHRFAASLPSTPIILDADGMRLSQVLGNLLCNAAKYTPPSGQVWLTARRTLEGVEISVRDDGIGIEPDKLPHVFDMFMQANSSKSRSYSGLGLGLALAKKLVELHGGQIEGRSAGEKEGSEFIVRLPEALICTPTRPRASRAKITQVQSPRRILVVDDMRDAAFVLSALLQKLGHQVETARDAIAAIGAVPRFRPEVVFSDIAMPGTDGYELAKQLRQLPEMSGVLLIALSGHAQESDRQKAFDAGFNHYLVKPVSIDALRELFGLPTQFGVVAAK